jgi:hypothetical protein
MGAGQTLSLNHSYTKSPRHQRHAAARQLSSRLDNHQRLSAPKQRRARSCRVAGNLMLHPSQSYRDEWASERTALSTRLVLRLKFYENLPISKLTS